MNQTEYRHFKEIFDDAHRQPVSSPYSPLLLGLVNHEEISNCLKHWHAETGKKDPLLESIDPWLCDEVDPEKIEKDAKVPEVYLHRLRSLGCMRARIPRKYGGLGLSQCRFSRLLEKLSSWSEVLALIVSVQQLGVAQGLLSLKKLESQNGGLSPASEELCSHYLRRLSEDATGAFCLTTAETGSDPSRLQTIAMLSGQHDYYVLSGNWEKGGKLFTTLGTIADIYIMLAVVLYPGEQLDRINPRNRITAFIVDRETPGIEIKSLRFCGWHGLPNAAIKLDGVRIPKRNQVGEIGHGLKIAFMNLGSGRINVAAIALGMMKQLERVARWWSVERVQGGKPIGEHALNTKQLVEMNATVYATEAFLQFVSAYADQSNADYRLEAAMLKLFSSHALVDIADETLQLRGGRGYETYASQKLRGETPIPVERLFRSARMMKIGEGGSNILKLYIMRCLFDELLQYSQQSTNKASLRENLYRSVNISKIFLRSLMKSDSSRQNCDCPPEIRRHLKFIDKKTRYFKYLLVRIILGEYIRYYYRVFTKSSRAETPLKPEQQLEGQQVLLGYCAQIATLLSVMTATCRRAIEDADQSGIILADEYCLLAGAQISTLFQQLKMNTAKRQRVLTRRGRQIMLGKFAGHVEKNIVPFDLPRVKTKNNG